MITVHHLNNSRSQRILWLLEELGLPYELKLYQRDPKTMLAPPELKKVHPLGKSPVLEDEGVLVAESAAIIEYLLKKYDPQHRLHPRRDNSPLDQKFTYWLHYAEGSVMPPLLLKLIFGKIKTTPMPFFIKPIAKGIAETVLRTVVDPQLKNHFQFIESQLQGQKWLCGEEFSAADIQMSFPLEAGEARGATRGKPQIEDYLKRMRSRPAYKKALERGGPFELLF